jgi:hypothetical protein
MKERPHIQHTRIKANRTSERSRQTERVCVSGEDQSGSGALRTACPKSADLNGVVRSGTLRLRSAAVLNSSDGPTPDCVRAWPLASPVRPAPDPAAPAAAAITPTTERLPNHITSCRVREIWHSEGPTTNRKRKVPTAKLKQWRCEHSHSGPLADEHSPRHKPTNIERDDREEGLVPARRHHARAPQRRIVRGGRAHALVADRWGIQLDRTAYS